MLSLRAIFLGIRKTNVDRCTAAEEGAVGGDAAEGDTASGGTGEVGWEWQPEEDFRQELVGDRQRGHFQARDHALVLVAAAHSCAAGTLARERVRIWVCLQIIERR